MVSHPAHRRAPCRACCHLADRRPASAFLADDAQLVEVLGTVAVVHRAERLGVCGRETVAVGENGQAW